MRMRTSTILKRKNGKSISATRWMVVAVALFFAIGCEVTQEKIQLWKGTKNGPHKLADAVTDEEIQIGLRANAAVALVEINSWELLRESLGKIKKEDAERVVGAMVPALAWIVEAEDNADGKALSKLEVDAKDALFIVLNYTSGNAKDMAEKALIDWCVRDYNGRAMAGQYNIKTIVKKIGPKAAEALVPLLSVDQLVIKYIAELIVEVGDKKVLEKASSQLAADLRKNLKKLDKVHLISAAVIGGIPVAEALLEFATDKELGAELQRYCLRALSDSIDKKVVVLAQEHIDKLFEMAESPDFDKYQREETYYVIAQNGRKEDVPRIRKLLVEKSSFWRAVGFRCILRMDGEEQLSPTLKEIERLKLTKGKSDIEEIVSRIASFPNLLPEVRKLLDDSSSFIKAIAVGVLGKHGTNDDKKVIQELSNSKIPLPKGFEHKTLGEAAQAALGAIQKRG
jgi:hypothetical protein